jgi:hypothetical protein
MSPRLFWGRLTATLLLLEACPAGKPTGPPIKVTLTTGVSALRPAYRSGRTD